MGCIVCAGCHGADGFGGLVDEDLHGDDAGETMEAIFEESEMRFLACMPRSDIDAITDYLMGIDHDNDGDGINDDDDDDDDNDGIRDEDDSDDDNDGIDDDDEREYGTDPRDYDCDDDGLNDGEERTSGTDPWDPDTDDDGATDYVEVVLAGTDPLDANSKPPVEDAAQATDNSGGGAFGIALLAGLAAIGLRRRRLYGNGRAAPSGS